MHPINYHEWTKRCPVFVYKLMRLNDRPKKKKKKSSTKTMFKKTPII